MIVKVVVVVVVLIALVVAVVLIAGARAPVRHIARVSTSIDKPASEVWALVGDLSAWSSWNTALDKLTRAPDQNGHAVWTFEQRRNSMPAEVLQQTPPSSSAPGKLVTRIADDKLPFGGTWTWEIADDGAGKTKVAITEDGFINNVVFRGMSSLFFGYTGSQRAFLGALAKKLGQTPTLDENVEFPTT